MKKRYFMLPAIALTIALSSCNLSTGTTEKSAAASSVIDVTPSTAALPSASTAIPSSIVTPESSIINSNHTHEYKKHQGVVQSLSSTDVSTYYTCANCDLYFNSNKVEMPALNSNNHRLEAYYGKAQKISLIGRDFELAYYDEIVDGANKLMDSLSAAITEQKKSYSEIDDMLYEYEDYADFIQSEYNKYSTAYDLFLTDELGDSTDGLYSLYNSFQVYYRNTIPSMISDTKYKSSFFEGMTQAEIDAYLASLNPEADERVNELYDIINEAQSADNSTKNEIVASYKKIVDAGNEIARMYNYNNYLDYTFVYDYDRSYTPADISVIENYIKDYLVPTFNAVYEVSNNNYDSFSKAEKTEYNKVYNYMTYKFDEFIEYSKVIGGQFESNLKSLIDTGSYFFTKNSDDSQTAYSFYTKEFSNYVYFSGDYQDLSTFAHEYGHANAGLVVSDFDLAEVNSTADELLFARYLVNKYPTSKVYKQYLLDILVNMLYYGIQSYAVFAVENYAYTTASSNITATNLQNAWNNCVKKIGLTDAVGSDYWTYTAVYSPGYYISYAVSQIASLNIYATSTTDFDKAKQTYIKTFNFDADKPHGFTDICTYAGIDSVFTEACYTNIKTKILASL